MHDLVTIDPVTRIEGHAKVTLRLGDDGTVDDADAVTDGVDPDQVQFQGGFGALAGNPGDVEPIPVQAPWVDLAGFHHEAWPMPNGNIAAPPSRRAAGRPSAAAAASRPPRPGRDLPRAPPPTSAATAGYRTGSFRRGVLQLLLSATDDGFLRPWLIPCRSGT